MQRSYASAHYPNKKRPTFYSWSFSWSLLKDSEPIDVDSCKWVQALTIEERQTQSSQRIGGVVDLCEVNQFASFRCVKLNFVTFCGPNLVRVPQVAPFDGDRGGGHSVYSLVKRNEATGVPRLYTAPSRLSLRPYRLPRKTMLKSMFVYSLVSQR